MIKPKKSLGQNFLIDKNICNKIVSITSIKNKNIIEIGPGKGFLTDHILKHNPKIIYLIEKDVNLYKYLEAKYRENFKIKLINKDILKYNLKHLNDLIIFSNLPYNVSTKIILYLFENYKYINEIIVMIQKEVALKFDYNLSRMNKYKFFTKLTSEYARCFNVSSNVFKPKPKVESTVVRFQVKKNYINFKKAKKFSNIIFLNRRKKISNKITINKLNKSKLIEKRIDQITASELFKVYNFF